MSADIAFRSPIPRRHLADTSPTLGRHFADNWPILDRYLTDVSAINLPIHMTYDWYATDSWPICHRQLTDISPAVDWYTADIWPIFGRGASTKYRPILGRYSVDITSTVPTVNMIRIQLVFSPPPLISDWIYKKLPPNAGTITIA